MKLTETLIRKIIREELLREMGDQGGMSDMEHYDNIVALDYVGGVPSEAWESRDTFVRWYLDYMADEMPGDADSTKDAMMGAEAAYDDALDKNGDDAPQDDGEGFYG